MYCTYIPLLFLSAFVLKLNDFKIFNEDRSSDIQIFFTTRVLCPLVGKLRTCVLFVFRDKILWMPSLLRKKLFYIKSVQCISKFLGQYLFWKSNNIDWVTTINDYTEIKTLVKLNSMLIHKIFGYNLSSWNRKIKQIQKNYQWDRGQSKRQTDRFLT